MSRIQAQSRRFISLWVVLALLSILMVTVAFVFYQLQRSRVLADFDELAKDDLELIEYFVRDALQQQDYQRIDGLLKEWGKRRRNTHTLSLTAENGFVFGLYQLDQAPLDPIKLDALIPYSYKEAARLELTKDRKFLDARLNRLRLELVLAVLLIGFVLWRLVLLSIRERDKALALRRQTSNLDKANARLRDVADEMQRMRSYLKNIFDSMPSILVGVDAGGKVTQWNISAERATKIKSDQAVGRHFCELLPWLEPQNAKLREAIDRGVPLRADRVVTASDHSDLRYSDVMIYPLVSNGTHGAVIRVDDVTERIRIEQMMVQTEKMMTVGGLAAGMAHEINNPLSGVLQSCQNIIRRLSPELEANRQVAESVGLDMHVMHSFLQQRGIPGFLEGIHDAAARAGRIVADMLSFSRRSITDFSPVRVEEMLDIVVRLASSDYDLKKKYDFKQIDIRREYDPNLGPILCDRTEIEQVLLNLMKNAAQAMAEHSRIHPKLVLRTAREGQWARIEMQDNGPGMDRQTQQRLFEPFFTTKPTGEGTGLGLSVSYFIIAERHKGRISVKSAPGEGAYFTILLPLSEVPETDVGQLI